MQPGFIFGKYKIIRQLGRGGMGVVFLAEDTMLMRQVALKVLDRFITSNPNFEHRFLQEARTIAGLNHPNIVPIHALSHIDDDWVIEMPYIEGGSLMDAEEKGRLEIRQILRYIRDILLALATCHESDVIHRDVKPSNILLNDQQRGLLSDFGLAKLLSDHQYAAVHSRCSASMFIGTPRYAPPESWEAHPATPAWDIYSTGMVLYEAIAGSTPYDAKTPMSLMKQMLERPIPPLQEAVPEVSAQLSGLVARMLAFDPDERPRDVADVLECFWSLPELSGDSTSPPVLIKPPVRRRPLVPLVFRGEEEPGRRGKKLIGAAVGIAAALLAVSALLVVSLHYHMPQEPLTAILHADSAPPAATVESAPHHSAFDCVDMESQEVLEGYGMALFAGDMRPWRLLAAGPAHLWALDMRPESENLIEISGHWADYDRTSAMRFRQGTLRGKGRWVYQRDDLAISLTFENLANTAIWERSFLFKRAAGNDSSARFVCTIASAEAVASLVYNELLPRDAVWAASLETTLITLGHVHLGAARFDRQAAPFQLDGKLNESVWRASLENAPYAAGQIEPVVGPVGAFLRACHDDAALYLGIHLPKLLDGPRLFIALQTAHAVPPAHAPRWILQADGVEIVASKSMRAGMTTQWNCDWEIAEHHSETMHEFEIRIPFAGLGKSATSITGKERWLLNCQLGQALPSGMRTVARWGDEHLENASCGLVLRFIE